MKMKPEKLMLIIAICLLAIISMNILSATELDTTNDTISSEKIELLNENDNPNSFEGDEIYVKQDIVVSGNGSENSPFKTIKEAIKTANTGTKPITIFIHNGTYEETNMIISNSVVIKSLNGRVILNANNNGWFFYSNNATNYLSLHGLIFKNGINYDDSDSTEGGVVKTKGHLDVVNCTFENNFGGTGGAINSHNGANIINSTFKNNKAEYNGAAAYVLNGQTNIISCTFINNTAKRQGGALRIQGNTYIEGSIFEDNIAITKSSAGSIYAGNGGAVRVTDGNLLIESSIFKNNSAGYEGGAISVGDDSQYSTSHYSLNINNSVFTENKARSGSAIIANDGINMTNSVLANNSVPYSYTAHLGQGSGIYVLNGDTILIGNQIANNTNKYNRESVDVYSYKGNIAEKDNMWGENSGIKTNNGKTSNEVTYNPNINKPLIEIEFGSNPKTNENNIIQKDTSENSNTKNNQNHVNENNNLFDKLIQKVSNNQNSSNNQKNHEYYVNENSNLIKTNSSSEIVSNGNIGEESENPENDGDSSNDGTTHEIIPTKSIITNKYTIPSVTILIIVILAFIIGYSRKKEDD